MSPYINKESCEALTISLYIFAELYLGLRKKVKSICLFSKRMLINLLKMNTLFSLKSN